MTQTAIIAIGCDVSQKTIDIYVFQDDKHIKIHNNQKGFEKLVQILPETKNYHICMEATGNYYEDFADFMAVQGYAVTVVNPLKISAFAKTDFQKTKTDKQDAKLIARYCTEKLLCKKGSYQVPTEQQYQVKRLLSYLRQLKIQKTALRNRQKSCKDDFVLGELQRQLNDMNRYIQAAQKKLAECTQNETKERLKTIPAIAENTAQVLSHFLTMYCFNSANKFVAFAGLNPQQVQSGTSINKRDKLSKYGNRILRAALYMPAVVAYRMGVFRQFTDRLEQKGKKGKVIIVAIMRKLAVLAFTLYHKRQDYDVNFKY